MSKQPKQKIQDKPILKHSSQEKITIGWCDNGLVEGRFMAGVTNTIIAAPKNNLNIVNTLRVQGNQIARQRQALWDFWDKLSDSDWLLWVDSDIVITPEVISMLWSVADKKTKPVVTGVYFVSSENEKTLMEPVPAIYLDTGDLYTTSVIHPLPANQIIPVDVAGFGLMLMHRSIIEPVNAVAGDVSVFGENQQSANKFISEDVSFCRNLKKAGFQLYAHTGATVQHMKTFSYDINYYQMYWSGVAEGKIKRKKDIGKQ